MARLVPIPFDVLVTRIFGELERGGPVLDLPRRRFFQPVTGQDLSVEIHGRRAATPFGPAAGPQSQLAQNVVLAWLAGARVIELKTVQVRDDLVIPRPCIDMATVGFNVEWSQELTLRESLEEYVKAAVLVEMLKASGLAPGAGDTVYDMSVGYDLAGIRSDRVRAFLAGMRDARALVDRLRREVPARWRHLRDVPVPDRISDTLTLSTFHGCPPGEIERICEVLLEEEALHVVVKLNPTLLGAREVSELLRDRLGYRDIEVPASAFDKDATWDQVVDFVGRLAERARRAGRGFGVKTTNTLVVRNHRSFFPPSEREMYLSGPPLHVLAVALVRRLRRTFGDAHPVSFSAGVDAGNFADAVALGLKPVTVCSDLLAPGGYGRAASYFGALSTRMKAAGAADLETFTLLAHGRGAAEAALERAGLDGALAARCQAALDGAGDLRAAAGEGFARWVAAARVLATERYVEQALADPRYGAARNATPPRKVGSRLALFDCLTCDKCIPVCPNDANFSLPAARGDLPVQRLVPSATGFALEESPPLRLERPRQIASFADACNACGHCDVMCPEDGGPYLVKPHFFGSPASWAAEPGIDGFALDPQGGGVRVHARVGGREAVVEVSVSVAGSGADGGAVAYRGDGFDLTLDPRAPAATARGTAQGPVDLVPLHLALRLLEAVRVSGVTTWPGAVLEARAAAVLLPGS